VTSKRKQAHDDSRKLQEAREARQRAMRIDLANPRALFNLGSTQAGLGQWLKAAGLFRQVLALEPGHIDASIGLANCLMKQGDPGSAETTLKGVLEVVPGHLEAHEMLIKVHHQQNNPSKIHQEHLRRALFSDGVAGPKAEFEVAHASLVHGEMPLGWDQYEARFEVPGLIHPVRSFTQPRWHGEPFPGRTLLLHYEQGFGDTLMFVRYAPMVKALGGKVLLVAQAPLADLVATCGGIDEVIPANRPLPDFDLHLPLLSLPRIFRTDLDSIPAEIPYLDVPDQVPNRQRIAEILSTSEGQIRIGLVWAGSSTHKRDGERSIPPALLAPLGALPEVAWHSFQLGATGDVPLPGLVSLDPCIRNFSDTAYALSGMQLVITVDTALAHLAGALGIPTLLLVSFLPDFRWMLGREDSPWYPTMRIYRQPRLGDWEAVIQQVLADLRGDQDGL
jgi:hypothetical protein